LLVPECGDVIQSRRDASFRGLPSLQAEPDAAIMSFIAGAYAGGLHNLKKIMESK
jgi:hypothetical protein